MRAETDKVKIYTKNGHVLTKLVSLEFWWSEHRKSKESSHLFYPIYIKVDMPNN